MEISLTEQAEVELDEAVAYYNSEQEGLGQRFLLEFVNATERILQFPRAWHPFTHNTRRCLLRKFPYGIIYQILNSKILIFAVMHLHREPSYWHLRIKN